jgi:hypothetical protein
MSTKDKWDELVEAHKKLLIEMYENYPDSCIRHLSVRSWWGMEDFTSAFNILPSLLVLTEYYQKQFVPSERDISVRSRERNLSISMAEEQIIKERYIDLTKCISSVARRLVTEVEGQLAEAISQLVLKVGRLALHDVQGELSYIPEIVSINDEIKDLHRVIGRREKARLGFPSKGRPLGSRKRTTEEQTAAENMGHRQEILAAIYIVCADNPSLEPETKKAVAKAMGKDVKTLNSWIRKGELDWDELLAEGGKRKK